MNGRKIENLQVRHVPVPSLRWTLHPHVIMALSAAQRVLLLSLLVASAHSLLVPLGGVARASSSHCRRGIVALQQPDTEEECDVDDPPGEFKCDPNAVQDTLLQQKDALAEKSTQQSAQLAQFRCIAEKTLVLTMVKVDGETGAQLSETDRLDRIRAMMEDYLGDSLMCVDPPCEA